MTTRLNRSLGLAGAIAMLVLGLMIVRAQAQQGLVQCAGSIPCASAVTCTPQSGTCSPGVSYTHMRVSPRAVRSCGPGIGTCNNSFDWVCYKEEFMVWDPATPSLGGCQIVLCDIVTIFTGCNS